MTRFLGEKRRDEFCYLFLEMNQIFAFFYQRFLFVCRRWITFTSMYRATRRRSFLKIVPSVLYIFTIAVKQVSRVEVSILDFYLISGVIVRRKSSKLFALSMRKDEEKPVPRTVPANEREIFQIVEISTGV